MKVLLEIEFDKNVWVEANPELSVISSDQIIALIRDSGLLDGIKDGVTINIPQICESDEEKLNMIKAEKLNTFIRNHDITCYVDEEGVKLPIKEFEEVDRRRGIYTAFSEEETLLYHYLMEDEIEVELPLLRTPPLPTERDKITFLELLDFVVL
jgi:hypothetical protein